ncbi:MAG: ribonuclease H-like domain-containing protein [Lachnospiraceae bacterium]|jgi:uncharacterized protein YprB with RNaseH-like and TPR domain|nr:ribonuclease H-like domain-containing protein [Lachnospiraceae bacterium]
MHTQTDIIYNYTVRHPLDRIAPLGKILFLDIETTGLSPDNAQLYMIGVAYYNNSAWRTVQWLAEKPEEEPAIITAFFQFAASYTHIFHFNGNSFDIPFILNKCAKYGLSHDFEQLTGVDIYRRVSPYRELLGLSNCKQKTIEGYLGLGRKEDYDGSDLIAVYLDFVKNPSPEGRQLLVAHNTNDLRGMLEILPILAIHDLFGEPLKALKVQANHYTDADGLTQNMLYMRLQLPTALPGPISFNHNGCYFKGDGEEGYLAVPLYDIELKYFYANYKDYYYLPAEDAALHKSIAAYVDKSHRVQATAANCYTRKKATYLQQWELMVEPFYKRDYEGKDLFFEVTPELKRERSFFPKYATHVLNVMKARI